MFFEPERLRPQVATVLPLSEPLPDFIVAALPYLVLALLPGMFLWAYISVTRREARRRRHLERFASEQGFSFVAKPPPSIHEQFERRSGVERFEPFDRGWLRSSRNASFGTRRGVRWQIFDYHCRCRTGSRGESREDYTIISAALPAPFQRTSIRPRGFMDRFLSVLGFPDVRIGDDHFDRRFRIASEDPAFPRALLQPEARRFLTSARHRHWQLGAPGILLYLRGYQPADRIAAAMQEIEAFVQLIPEDVLRSWRRDPASPTAE